MGMNRFAPIPATEPDTRSAAAWIGTLATELAAAELARAAALEAIEDLRSLAEEHDAECDDGLCSDCNGSGEGSYDGARCATCHGWGEVGADDGYDPREWRDE